MFGQGSTSSIIRGETPPLRDTSRFATCLLIHPAEPATLSLAGGGNSGKMGNRLPSGGLFDAA